MSTALKPSNGVSLKLSADLVGEAGRIGKVTRRSATGQIEYWAEIGKRFDLASDPLVRGGGAQNAMDKAFAEIFTIMKFEALKRQVIRLDDLNDDEKDYCIEHLMTDPAPVSYDPEKLGTPVSGWSEDHQKAVRIFPDGKAWAGHMEAITEAPGMKFVPEFEVDPAVVL